MKKLVILMGIAILLLISWDFYKSAIYHTNISSDQVENISIRDESKGEVMLMKEHQEEMINAFNAAKFIDDNDELAGTTFGCHVMIQLKSGHSIWLGGCGKSPEVQREDNVRLGNQSITGNVAYIIESPEMEQIIKSIIKPKP